MDATLVHARELAAAAAFIGDEGCWDPKEDVGYELGGLAVAMIGPPAGSDYAETQPAGTVEVETYHFPRVRTAELQQKLWGLLATRRWKVAAHAALMEFFEERTAASQKALMVTPADQRDPAYFMMGPDEELATDADGRVDGTPKARMACACWSLTWIGPIEGSYGFFEVRGTDWGGNDVGAGFMARLGPGDSADAGPVVRVYDLEPGRGSAEQPVSSLFVAPPDEKTILTLKSLAWHFLEME